MVKPIPDGYHSVTPYLIVDDAKAAIDFYTRALGAKEKFRLPMGDRIGHAEIVIGDSHVMLADEFPDMGNLGPKARGGTTVSLMVYVEDVDSAFRRAIEAGGTQERPVEIYRFYVDRSAHGTGVAAELMIAAIDAARDLGGAHVWLGVWERNARALAFYAKSGFRDIGVQIFQLGTDRQTDRVLIRPLSVALASGTTA